MAIQMITLFNIRLAKRSLHQQDVYYTTESILYSTMMKIARSQVNPPPWPPQAIFDDSFPYNGLNIKRRINYEDNTYEINVVSSSPHASRRLQAKLEKNITIEAFPLDIVLVIDKSGSMSDGDTDGSKEGVQECSNPQITEDCQPIKDAREAAKSMVDYAVEKGLDVRFGIITFNSQAYNTLGLTDISLSSTIKNNIDEIIAERYVEKVYTNTGTNIGGGFYKASKMMKETKRKEALGYIILLSDGVPTSRYTDPDNSENYLDCENYPLTHNQCTYYQAEPDSDGNNQDNDSTGEDKYSAVNQAIAARENTQKIYTIGLNLDNTEIQNASWCPGGIIGGCVMDKTSALVKDTMEKSASQPEYFFSVQDSTVLDEIYKGILDQIIQVPAMVIRELPSSEF
jgi:uncharacterized protein YegL